VTAEAVPFRLEGPFPPFTAGCQCDGYCKGRRYTCPGCRRFLPFCYGAADEFAELCDDCACVAKDRANGE